MMTAERFSRGYDPENYVSNLRNYRSFVKGLMPEAEAANAHVERLQKAIANLTGPVRATMMTEDWCGDSACNTPVLTDLFSRAGIEFRVFRGSEETDLKEKYESEGADHIPVVSLWDGNAEELLRWIEAPEAVQKKKDRWKAERPEFMELYKKQKSDAAAAKQFASLYKEFLETMATWYKEGDWAETTREIVEAAENG